MTPEHAVIDAHTRLLRARQLWPVSAANLLGLGPLSERGAQSGYPSGGEPGSNYLTRYEQAMEATRTGHGDPARTALRRLDHELHEVTASSCRLLDIEARRWGRYSTPARLHGATMMVELCTHLTLSRHARTDADYVLRYAANICDIVAQWAYKARESEVVRDIGNITNSPWCTNHSRHNMFEPRAEHAGSLCDFCFSYRKARGQRPELKVLRKKASGQHLTDKDLSA